MISPAELDGPGLTPRAGMDLRFDGPVPAAELRGREDCLLGAVRYAAPRDGDSETGYVNSRSGDFDSRSTNIDAGGADSDYSSSGARRTERTHGERQSQGERPDLARQLQQ